MSHDLRRYAKQTNIQLIIGFLLILFIVGDGLIYLRYGSLIGSSDGIIRNDQVNMIRDNGIISINNWMMRIQRPAGAGPFPIQLMLHGWMGDENSMWVFSPRLLKNALLIAPRGLYKTEGIGYSWHTEISKPWPWVNDFMPAVEALIDMISINNFPDGNFSEQHIQ
jgi:hypothetical protein